MILLIIFFIVALVVVSYLAITFKRNCGNMVTNYVIKHVDKHQRILDVGSGTGCVTKHLMQSGYDVTPIDVVDMGTCVKPTLFDGARIPFADNSFDVCICAFVLHHTENQLKLIREMSRVARMLIIFEDVPDEPYQWDYVAQHAKSDWGQCIQCFHLSKDWINIFKDAGLAVTDTLHLGNHHCPFARKPWYYPVDKVAFILKKNGEENYEV